jgi:hypothetical protein
VKRHVFRPAAAGDVERAYAWYEQQREGLGEEFLAEVWTTVQAVLDSPERYPVLHRQTRRRGRRTANAVRCVSHRTFHGF